MKRAEISGRKGLGDNGERREECEGLSYRIGERCEGWRQRRRDSDSKVAIV